MILLIHLKNLMHEKYKSFLKVKKISPFRLRRDFFRIRFSKEMFLPYIYCSLHHRTNFTEILNVDNI